MNKQTYTEWYEGLKARLANGYIDQKQFEWRIVDNLNSMIMKFYNRRYDMPSDSQDTQLELVNHYFELIAEAEISKINAALLLRSVMSTIKNLPAAMTFMEKHGYTDEKAKLTSFFVSPFSGDHGEARKVFENNGGWYRKQVAGTPEKMVGRPVITEIDISASADYKPVNEVTIELPWKLALHVYRGFLIKRLASKHGYNLNDAYQYIDDHLNEYSEILAEELDAIIADEESHLVSVGGGITAAGTGLVVGGIIKPEE